MAHITFDYYEVWYHGRSCQILIPGDISCRKNSRLFLDRYFSPEPEWMEFVDLVFMKPNSLKIEDWKEILEPNLEKNFLEDMIRFHNGEKGVILRGQTSCLFGWCAPKTNGAGVFFWDDDIFQKAEDKICLGI